MPAQDWVCQHQGRLLQNTPFFIVSSHTAAALMRFLETSREPCSLKCLVSQREASSTLLAAFMTQPSSLSLFPRNLSLVFFLCSPGGQWNPAFPSAQQPRGILLAYCGQRKRRPRGEMLFTVSLSSQASAYLFQVPKTTRLFLNPRNSANTIFSA